ncbi:MAG: elongation factor G [Ignavibacteriales bacterium]|nr:elongation factor G [Ignavibacteriales bacterium]
MKEYGPEAIRNIALIGHGGSGKTSLSELILFTAGEINRIGKIEEGNTVSDYNPNEIERQISITAAPLHIEWNNTKINFIDTPGYSDFVGQVKGSLRIVDTAVSIIKSAEGVEVGTETTWNFVKNYNLPAAIIINKIDNEHSKFAETVKSTKEILHPDVTVITYPVREGMNFDTVIDILKMKAYTYGDAGSRKVTEAEIPADKKADVEKLREELVEKIAESSEDLMNKFFENGTLTDEELIQGLKIAILKRSLIPVFAISATKGVGVNNFIDFVNKYFPTPLERGNVEAKLKDKGTKISLPCDAKAEPVLFIFKTLLEQHVGELSFFKVFSGTVTPGLDLINQSNVKTERLGQLFMMNGKNRQDIAHVLAGDIGAVVKLKDTHTNNTLSSKNFAVIIDPIVFPDPIIHEAVVPKAKGDEDKISAGLHTLHEEDPTFISKFDPELSQTVASGQGELQLQLAVKLLKDRYGVDVDLKEPKIPYRETIKGRCDEAEYKHKKQSGGRGQFGHVFLKLEPLPRGGDFQFVNAIVGGVIPGRFIPAVEKGIIETMTKGILSGSKMVDIKVTLYFGSFHDVDSDEISFKIAGAQAFKKGFLDARPVLLEPIYEVEVKVPDEFMGDVMGNLSSRRGKILGMDSDGPFQIIKANVPLSELYKYSTHLRSLTSGRGMYKAKFSYYEEIPKEVEAKVIEEYKKSKEEE